MDKLAISGLLITFGSLIIGQWLGGGSLTLLLNAHALLIVLGGTLGAVMLQTPWPIFRGAFQHLHWVFVPPRYDYRLLAQKLYQLGNLVRKEGFLSLEAQSSDEEDRLCRQGLTLLIDGIEPQILREVLEQQMDMEQEQLERYASIYESMGGYSPTIGILGAVLGLIQAMSFLATPDQLGNGIAVAFVATIYGVGFANLIFLPIANRLRQLFYQYSIYQEMIIVGLASIAIGESSLTLARRLNIFIPES
ncbi:flagellar motor protein [Celerinatantimonas yamalensis]|uniref:Flagellar motor protein n=1 Tax=Celerinatantimonas yamalensis TaxID=559956 RepID=A0ABW9G620_9GAMM